MAVSGSDGPRQLAGGHRAGLTFQSRFGFPSPFRGSEYIRFDVAVARLDAGFPRSIASTWGNGKACFFKGTQYVRFDLAADAIDAGFSTQIMGYWPGMPF